MKVNTPKACNALGLAFFAVVTIIEIIMFCHLFDAFGGGWIKAMAIGMSTVAFNTALWFFALTYHKTLLNVKNRK